MDKINNLLELVEGKIKQNILQISSLKSLNDNLNYENIRLSKENDINQKKIQELEDKFKALKIANTISLNENTVNETKIEINKLINEIDMCISQISD
mgnify:FL=1|tara:strand:+ start:137 stop:427 length:291 start_codon:yes stop_codon:yes gene_type:complete